MLNDYDLDIQYCPDMANVMVNALSTRLVNWILTQEERLIKDIEALHLEVRIQSAHDTCSLNQMTIYPTLDERIRDAQNAYLNIRSLLINGK